MKKLLNSLYAAVLLGAMLTTNSVTAQTYIPVNQSSAPDVVIEGVFGGKLMKMRVEACGTVTAGVIVPCSTGGGGSGGDASAANQATQITAAQLTNTIMGAVTASPTANTINDRLKVINATLAAQGTPFHSGDSIGNTTFASTQSGAWNITNVSGTVSLPTGASTEATLAAQSAKLPATLGAKTGALSFSVVPNTDTAFPVSGTFWQATQPVSVASVPLPAGAATEATLAAQSAKLPASLGIKTAAGSLSIAMASDGTLPLPAGAATAANQSTNGTKLDQIHTDMIAATPAGQNLIGNNIKSQVVVSTTTVLGANAVYTSSSIDVGDPATPIGYSSFACGARSDAASTTTGFQIFESTDNTNWQYLAGATVGAATFPAVAVSAINASIFARYLRVVFNNGAAAQTTFYLFCRIS